MCLQYVIKNQNHSDTSQYQMWLMPFPIGSVRLIFFSHFTEPAPRFALRSKLKFTVVFMAVLPRFNWKTIIWPKLSPYFQQGCVQRRADKIDEIIWIFRYRWTHFFMKSTVSAEYLYVWDFGNMNFGLVKCLRRQKKDISPFHLGNGFPVVYNPHCLGW